MKRRYEFNIQSPQQKLKLAQKYNLPIVLLDFPLTGRLKRTAIFAPDETCIHTALTASDALLWCADQGFEKLLLDGFTWPRAFFVTIQPYLRKKTWQRSTPPSSVSLQPAPSVKPSPSPGGKAFPTPGSE